MARILIVDDSPTVVLIARRILAAVGHEVSSITTLDELATAVDTWAPEVVLLDLELPGAGELPLAITPALARARIVIHSSRPPAELHAAADRLHAAAVVAKGSPPKALQDAVRAALTSP